MPRPIVGGTFKTSRWAARQARFYLRLSTYQCFAGIHETLCCVVSQERERERESVRVCVCVLGAKGFPADVEMAKSMVAAKGLDEVAGVTACSCISRLTLLDTPATSALAVATAQAVAGTLLP